MEIAASLIFEGFGIQEIQALAARQGGQQQNMGGGAGYDDSGEGDEQMMGGANGGGGNPLADLFNSPHANQIRQRIREDPDFYQAYMSKMAAENPQFY